MHIYLNKTNHWKEGLLQRWPHREEKRTHFLKIPPLREMYNETGWRYAILKFNTTSLYLKLYSPVYPITALLIPSKLKYNFSLIIDLKDVKLLIKRVTWQSSRQKSYFKMLPVSKVCLDTSKEKSINEVLFFCSFGRTEKRPDILNEKCSHPVILSSLYARERVGFKKFISNKASLSPI